MDRISALLENEFKNTPYSVVIYETRNPHRLIGLSTGGDVIKHVLTDDNKILCTDVESEECTIVQMTIDDLANVDDVLLKSHLAYSGSSPVYVRETDKVYETTFIEYRDSNLDWLITVTTSL